MSLARLNKMKFLIVGDLHGNVPNIYYKNFDAIIAPGDFCSDAARKYMFQAMMERIKNPKSKVQWYDIVGKKKAKDMIKQSLSDGRKILEKLNSLNIPIYIVPGNNDWTSYKESKWNFERINHYKSLVKGLENLIDVHNSLVNAEEFQFIGHGITSSPEYPQYKEDLKRYNKKELNKIKKDYTKDLKQISSVFEKSSKPVIFMTHNVPFNTPIDKIVNKESPKNGYHYGSLIARKLVDKYQPLICIGGHMHEHFAKCKIGKTVCINTGYGPFVNILLELEENKIKKLEFYKGK